MNFLCLITMLDLRPILVFKRCWLDSYPQCLPDTCLSKCHWSSVLTKWCPRVAPCPWVPCRCFCDGSGPALPGSPVMHWVISNTPHPWNLRDVPYKPVRRNNPRSFRSTHNDHASAKFHGQLDRTTDTRGTDPARPAHASNNGTVPLERYHL